MIYIRGKKLIDKEKDRNNNKNTMADMRGSGVICNESCGCPSPCPGGVACRCNCGGMQTSGGGEEHKKCSCGEHCGCNPCSCSKATASGGTGKAFCKCADGCDCVTCSS